MGQGLLIHTRDSRGQGLVRIAGSEMWLFVPEGAPQLGKPMKLGESGRQKGGDAVF